MTIGSSPRWKPRTLLLGTSTEAITLPLGRTSSKTILEVTPKLPSTEELLKTSGNPPPVTAVAQGLEELPVTQPAGSSV